jgi:acyl-CoA synthetase (AMP-forming)/AMP-acid ligase II
MTSDELKRNATYISTGGVQESQSTLAECYGDALLDLNRSLWELFADASEAYPNHDAVVSMWQRDYSVGYHPRSDLVGNGPHSTTNADTELDHGGHQDSTALRWSYLTLRQRSESLAMYLQKRGCRAGMPLVTILWNSAEWALCFWAAVRLGMVFVPLDPRLVASDAQYFLEVIKPTVLVAQGLEEEESIQKHAPELLASVNIKLSCSENPGSDWTSLPLLFNDSICHAVGQAHAPGDTGADADSACPENSHIEHGDSLAHSPAMIVFTSGTTSRPKGCHHTARNIWAQTHDYDPRPGQFERWLVHTPVSHMFAVNNSLRAWRKGDAVVFPSKTFNVQSTLRALIREKCTYMSAIPAIINAILAQPDFPGPDALSLRYVTLGSTLISKSDIVLCRDKLGSEDAIQCFGMSEGAPVISWLRPDPLLRDGFHPGVGKVLPGANMRICAPGERRPLGRNQLGELHIGGPSVITGYIGGVSADSFYSDHIGNWLVTGDQGLIDDDGVLHITGRYKDIIIRAGENIAPVKIENVLSEIPGVMVSNIVN